MNFFESVFSYYSLSSVAKNKPFSVTFFVSPNGLEPAK